VDNSQTRKKRIGIFGGSFNPPCKHHFQIIERVIHRFDRIIVFPCGRRWDKPSANILSEEHRKEMARLAFEGIPKVEIDYLDLDNKIYTPTYYLQKRYENIFPDAEIWHIVGGDIIIGGRNGTSEIHQVWHRGSEIWQSLNFTVIVRPGYEVEPEDMPPHSESVEIKYILGSGTMVRSRILHGESIDEFVAPNIIKYIQKHKLYLE